MSHSAYPKTRWFVLFNIFVGYLCVGVFTIAFSPIIGSVVADLKLDPGTVSAATMATISLFSAISSILAGPIIDKFGVPKTTIAGGVLMVLGAVLVPVLGHSIPGIIVIRLIQGLGFGPISVCLPIIASRWFPENERAIANGLQGSGMAFGIAIGFVLAPLALGLNGGVWQNALAWLGILPAISLILCIATAFLKWPPAQEAAASSADKANDHLFSRGVKQASFFIGLLVMFFFLWIMNAFNDLTPGYIALVPPTGLGFGATVAGMNMLGVQVGTIIGSIASGFFLTKIFKGKVKPTLILAFAMIAVFTLSVRFSFVYNTQPLMIACLFITGFFEGFIIPVMTTFIATNYPQSIMGKIFGISFGISIFGGTIGISAGAAALHVTGNYLTSITVVSVVGIVGVVLAAILKPTKGFALAEHKSDAM